VGHRGRLEVRWAGGGESDTAAVVAAVALGVALVGAFFLVDPRAEAAFDAPKRLAALAGIVVAAVALLVGRRPLIQVRWAALSLPARAAAILAGVAVALVVLSVVASPRSAAAVASLRVVLLFALLLPLGASRALDGLRGRSLLVAFVVAAAVSGGVAAGQVLELWTGVTVESFAGRSTAFALVGNEGVLALALALAALGCLAPWLSPTGWRPRALSAAALVLVLVGMAGTGNVTGGFAFIAGGAVVVLLAFPRRSLVLAGAVAGAAVIVTMMPPVRARLGEFSHNLRHHRTNALTSGRLAPWAAAVEMVRERPLLGFGPGTFGAEFAPHRVAAELRLQRRLLHPKITSSFSEAHCEPLQAAAEWGVPAAVASMGAFAVLLSVAARMARRGGAQRAESILLLALLTEGAVAALLWFPLQRPVTALPLLLAAGRCWRLAGGKL
jgi:putative inorganic carbon (HCO3(-)) transporter